MPPVAEVDPAQRRIGLERTTAAALAVAGTLAVSTSEAVADSPNRVEIEKQALAAFGSTALTRTIDSEPIASDSANEATTTIAPDPDLERLCIKAGLARPKIKQALLASPGDRQKQAYRYTGIYRPMPEVCRGLYTRIAKVKFEIENPKNHKQRSKVNNYGRLAGGGEYLDDDGGTAGDGFGTYPYELPKNSPKLYRCTPGKGVTHAYVTGRHWVKNLTTREIVADKKVFTEQMTIQRSTKKGPLRYNRPHGPC